MANMNPEATETYRSLETSLHFALKDEEILYLLCDEKYDSTKSADCQSEEVDSLLCQWRLQKRICERLAKTLHDLNPWYMNEAFEPATLDGQGIGFLKRLVARQENGTNILPVRKD